MNSVRSFLAWYWRKRLHTLDGVLNLALLAFAAFMIVVTLWRG